MSRIGTKENPLKNAEGVTIARAVLKDAFSTPGKKQGVWWYQGCFWVWAKGRWERVEQENMRLEMVRWMTDKHVMCKEDPTMVEELVVTRYVCEEVLFAMKALTEAWWKKTPVWVDRKGPAGMDADYCVGFEDVVVCVAEGKLWMEPRDEGWFDTAVLPVEFDMGAECPRWKRCLEQWGNGDKEWGRLLQRWMGYLLVPHREYRKMLLMEGVTAAGKGVICAVVQAMLGNGYFSTECDTLAEDFSLNGVQHARVCSVTEMSRLDMGGGQKVARVLKNLVGGDPITINEKYQVQMRNVVCRAAVMMSSNQIPMLPNESQGLSAKMLVLPFTVSFDRGGAESGLKDRLVKEELQGIVAWAMTGLLELERAKQEERWPEPQEARDVVLKFKVMNNPMASFLETRFVEDPKGWTAARVIRREWEDFLKETGVRYRVPNNQLLVRLEQDGGWMLKRGKRREDTGLSPLMGMQGLRLKANAQEWL